MNLDRKIICFCPMKLERRRWYGHAACSAEKIHFLTNHVSANKGVN